MAKLRFAEGLKVYPVIAPVAGTTSAIASVYVDVADYNWLTWLVQYGVVTSDSTDTLTLTVECSTANSSNATEVALPFFHRVNGPVGTDSIGVITSDSTSGLELLADSSADAMAILISIDPSTIPGELTDGRFCRLVCTPSSAVGAFVVSACFLGEPKYQMNSIPSST
jgi:hypothetical protein